MRLAAIDIGTNSIRCVVAEVDSDGSYRVLDEEREMTRLGHDLFQRGRLADGADGAVVRGAREDEGDRGRLSGHRAAGRRDQRRARGGERPGLLSARSGGAAGSTSR